MAAIGGGSRNELLCQLTADATGCPVLAGPAEATASGTLLLQALARGRLSSLSQIKEVIARSCRLVSYEPHPVGGWDECYAAFLRLAG
jgi:rhamnulokinase